jgi:hypothetical protein
MVIGIVLIASLIDLAYQGITYTTRGKASISGTCRLAIGCARKIEVGALCALAHGAHA